MLLTLHLQVFCPMVAPLEEGLSQAHVSTPPFRSAKWVRACPPLYSLHSASSSGAQGCLSVAWEVVDYGWREASWGWLKLSDSCLSEVFCYRCARDGPGTRNQIQCSVMWWTLVSQAQAGQRVCSSFACVVWAVWGLSAVLQRSRCSSPWGRAGKGFQGTMWQTLEVGT